MADFEIPLSPSPQTFRIVLAGVSYQMRLVWNAVSESWVLNIADASGVDILTGVPLVTGVDLLAPYGYLNFGGSLIAETDGDPLQPPSRSNLGDSGKLYFITP